MGLIRRLGRQALTAGLVLLLWSAQLGAQTPVTVSAEVAVDSAVTVEFEQLTANARVRAALEAIATGEPETIAEQIRLTEIPAPPFQEQQRAEYYLQQMQKRGLPEAYIDAEGNVVGLHRGTGDGPLLAIAAHLDTVFAAETDTAVELRDERYYAPGISDDGRGLTVLLTLIETLRSSAIATTGDILFIGNVGEEGLGDLRGIKAIFRDNPQIDGFVSIDGSGLSGITTGATGSRRFEVVFTGPGGHSFSAFGLVSAIHAMGRAIANISELETPSEPKTTFTVGKVSGGTSVNSIAAHAAFELDMRSNDAGELARLEARVREAVQAGVVAENARWDNNGEITVDFRLIGDRPSGRTSADSPIVQVAALAMAEAGGELQGVRLSSTDSNIPMALGIPAITITGGGESGGEHSPEEWFDPRDSERGPQMALLLVLGLVGVEGTSAPLLQRRAP
ncbi:MAG: M20/M25/M40 family metallo-hydrolase [Gammaproteobacteria bacterium]|nr:M20/M25/M40 family metallo-hydrolase [Gammaproteobacteria bacterium]